MGIFQKKISDCSYELLIKNKILLNDEIEIITPNHSTLARVKKIEHYKNGEVDVANTNDEIVLTFDCDDYSWQKEDGVALARTKGMKEF